MYTLVHTECISVFKNALFLITTQLHCYLALPLFQKVQKGSGAHPASCSVGVGVL